ncbi:MAG: TraB/GumN family protein [Crocinitomicaceae bacterium]|nr:TraB/GumN family protein [Crocinitomicaceae bacterium]
MRFLIFIILFFLSSSLFSQDSTARSFPMKEKALLWEISGSNIPKGSYLFGTMHLIEKEYFLFPKKLEKIVAKTKVLTMELPGLSNQMEAMSLVILKEGSFFDYFNEEQTDSILSWAQEKMHLDENQFRMTFSKMKPFAVAQLTTQMHFIGKTESYEMTFEKIAKEKEIEIKGLETIQEQIAVFDNMSNEQQAIMVMESISNEDSTIATMKNMQRMYNDQQIDSLYSFIVKEGGTISKEQNTFIDERNKNWIPKIEEMIKAQKTFIAVGAGHLGGPNGVIRLLERKGYALTPVKL